MTKKKRGWHFKKSFLAFVAGVMALIVLVLGACIARAVKNRNINQPDVKTPAQTPAEEKTSAPPTAPPTVAPTAPPVTDPNDRVVYLTFDDGPTKNTDRILEVLDTYGVKATFFVIHTYDGCEERIRKTHQKGHAIGLHSYTHDFSIYRSEETYFDDLNKISDLVYNATGTRSKLVRFPGGTSNTISRSYCNGIMSRLAEALPEKGYRYFDWDWDSTDAEANVRDADAIYSNAISAADYDDHQVILLMHDAAAKTTTVDALPRIIQYYQSKGYRFDVLSETSYTYQHNPNN